VFPAGAGQDWIAGNPFSSPKKIFIDEYPAIGGRRGSLFGSGRVDCIAQLSGS
jgi:hypothetical protein